jgi:hypothetical protein
MGDPCETEAIGAADVLEYGDTTQTEDCLVRGLLAVAEAGSGSALPAFDVEPSPRQIVDAGALGLGW